MMDSIFFASGATVGENIEGLRFNSAIAQIYELTNGLAKFVPDGSLLAMGLIPYLPGSVVKITLAAVILPSIWKYAKREQNL